MLLHTGLHEQNKEGGVHINNSIRNKQMKIG